jgi:2-polyprenyl-3-methyl-5-hydroxy-6-metoxy-1,4-benzoquinol methylase
LEINEIMDYSKLVNNVIISFKDNPIDLLNTGSGSTEYQYLNDLKYSYIRTVNDVAPLLQKGMKVLEIGSLFGVVSISLKQLGFSVTGADIPEFHQSKKLQDLYAKYEVTFDKVNLRDYKLPYADESFDMVIMCEVMEHLNFNPLPVMQEINRVLKKDGYVYIAMPNQACIDNRLKLLAGHSVHEPPQYFFDQLNKTKNYIVSLHWREYTMKETLEIIRKMGFTVVRNYFFGENGPTKLSVLSFVKKIFHIVPSFRTSLVVIGKKTNNTHYDFRFTEANS